MVPVFFVYPPTLNWDSLIPMRFMGHSRFQSGHFASDTRSYTARQRAITVHAPNAHPFQAHRTLGDRPGNRPSALYRLAGLGIWTTLIGWDWSIAVVLAIARPRICSGKEEVAPYGTSPSLVLLVREMSDSVRFMLKTYLVLGAFPNGTGTDLDVASQPGSFSVEQPTFAFQR